MATDPVRSIDHTTSDTAVQLDLASVLKDIAELAPSTDTPYLTISLDWSPDGSHPGRSPMEERKPSQRRADSGTESASSRPARTILENELASIIDATEPRSDVRASLEADRDRVLDYLNDEIDPAVSGLYVVANSARGVFIPVPVGVPLNNRFTTGPVPHLSALARLVDDHPAFAVLVIDQHDAILSVFDQLTKRSSLEVDSSHYPRKQQQGGWSQRRFQARADERVAAFARTVAEELRTAVADIDMLVLAGDEVIMSALRPELHQSVTAKVIDQIRLDIQASEDDILAAVEPIVRKHERELEQQAVVHLADRIGSDNRAVAGVDGVLTALQAGSVDTLIIADDFNDTGWADFALDLYGSGPLPAEHPAGGSQSDLVNVDLDEQLIRLATRTGAAIDIIRSALPAGSADTGDVPKSDGKIPRTDAATKLDGFSGVAALLRYDS